MSGSASTSSRNGSPSSQARSAWLITFRDGLQTSLTLYQAKADALEAARARG